MNAPLKSNRQTRKHRFERATISSANVQGRALWSLVWILLFRPTPRPMHRWRCWLLKRFGARIGKDVRVYQSARVWAPWNLELMDGSCLGDYVDCYNVAKVTLGKHAVVSQYSYLCSASRDYRDQTLPLVQAPIEIKDHAWVTADVFVGPGVSIGEGTVVTARSTVLHDLIGWVVASGNPAVPVKPREYEECDDDEQTIVAPDSLP